MAVKGAHLFLDFALQSHASSDGNKHDYDAYCNCCRSNFDDRSAYAIFITCTTLYAPSNEIF